ncbi:dephospho-CoA kinase [Flavobacterium hiemivividum]|uniref:Dephospho-CoA kinase n=1 Tax=Flavobacterium hiemivividum TaxID=2541734 RepID=A0A4R5D517_9FLAO|nr:dephospho-CoA kinase [Flavobacterium hiemivividum]TDE05475.1 dephospho-CoA kinase [Flavobacterium hiemivividum]
MTRIIGLTGGIGSGKTTIANHFKTLGIPVYIADDEARKIMQTSVVIDAIKKTFGETLFEGEVLKRDKLAQIVFNDPEKLQQLNEIVHPEVKRHFKQWLLEHKAFPIVVYEAAILFESGSYKDFDVIITVTAPLESRIQRVMTRDKTSREQVLGRINSQWTDEQRVSKSDYVIENIEIENAKRETENILKILRIKQNEY